MCEAETLQHIHQAVSDLSEAAARQVLAFARSLKTAHPEPKILSAEEETQLIAELRARAEARPRQTESAGEFMRKIRDKARY